MLFLQRLKYAGLKNPCFYLIFVLLLSACTGTKKLTNPHTNVQVTQEPNVFTIAFGSCNKPELENLLWDDVIAAKPDLWIWGGDNVYADTQDMDKMAWYYTQQDAVTGYRQLKQNTPIIGTWDDHDYGINDGGVSFAKKKESQQLLLDFLNVPKEHPRRKQEGGTDLTPDHETEKRNKPNAYGKGTILGETQWKWLAQTLNTSKADYNIIVTSVQFLSNEHGFECWGNFPHEVDRLQQLISTSKAKGVAFLSGDRHISEFSIKQVAGLSYPLIDFTSSGLTHAYRNFSGEPNPYRVGEVVFTESFGILNIDLKKEKISFKIVGDNGVILQEIEQAY